MDKSNKPRYDVLLAQLEYIKDKAAERLDVIGGNKDDRIFDQATDRLVDVCMNVKVYTVCKSPCRLEDGMCICD